MSYNLDIEQAAINLGHFLEQTNTRIVTAESCTGGWLAQCITAVAGSSAWFDRGFISYSNTAKTEMLNVPASAIQSYGAVSAQVATLMVQGALDKSRADYAIAITGIAGPGGATPDKPLGTVYLAWQKRAQAAVACLANFNGDREQVRQQAVYAALNLIPRE